MGDPRVDVILPAFRAAATVARAVESALDQRGVELRLLAVDDGSDDGTAEAIAAACAHDPRAVLIRAPHRGLVGALRTALHASDAPLVARLDADDVMLPGRLRAQADALAADPALAAVDGLVDLAGDPPEGMRRWAAWINGLAAPGAIERELLVESPLVHPGTTLRRAAIDAVGGYRDGPFPEDYDLWLRLHAAGWRLAKLPRPVVRMTDHPGRLTRTDPRYRADGFRAVRQRWLAATRLASPRRVALWCGRQEGRHWHRWLADRGCGPVARVDVHPRRLAAGQVHGVPVVPHTAVGELDADLLLVAVGARGARDEIRGWLAELVPSWREGEQWMAVC